MSAVHIILICFIPFTGTMNSINWPAPNVWVFMAQLVEHCSAHAEAMGSNPDEAPKTLFGLNLRLFKSQIHNSDDHIFISITTIIMTKIDYHEENRAAMECKNAVIDTVLCFDGCTRKWMKEGMKKHFRVLWNYGIFFRGFLFHFIL